MEIGQEKNCCNLSKNICTSMIKLRPNIWDLDNNGLLVLKKKIAFVAYY